jgi:hypothetical protein
MLKKIIIRLAGLLGLRTYIEREMDLLKINQGLILTKMNKNLDARSIQDYEFKIFSQWGEDGIIQKLVDIIKIENKTFIEFGVEDFNESNCRFLMMKDNWSGFVIDGSLKNIQKIKKSYYYWAYELSAHHAFITAENINDLLNISGFDYDLGLMSIDIDGVDYYVFDAIKFYKPRILILEYNSVFGLDRAITVPYDKEFNRSEFHTSNLFFGASLPAMINLASEKGYTFLGVNSSGNNGFFLRNDQVLYAERILDKSVGIATKSKFRESRSSLGDLTYLNGDQRLSAISGMTVFNTVKKVNESL